MKKIMPVAMIILSLLLVSSCGINHAYIYNQNLNTTHVQLAGNNYKTLERVTGSAEVEYVLFVGGMKKRQLYENAYADMVKNANLMTSSKALVNIVTEDHVGGVPPFYYKRVITVSAHVIEFTN